MLSELQIERYSRQIILPTVGAGAGASARARVALVGAGGLDVRRACTWPEPELGGSPSSMTRRSVAVRRHLRTSPSGGRASTCAVPECHADGTQFGLLRDGCDAETRCRDCGILAHDHDLLVDAGGVPEVTALLNVAALNARKPLVWGTAGSTMGEASVFTVPCYQCYRRRQSRFL